MYKHTDRVAHTRDCAALAGIFYMYSHRQGSTHHGLCCTGGIFYMYNHTDRVAHTTECAALVGYFTCIITQTG